MPSGNPLHSDRIRPRAGPKWLFGRVAQGLMFALTMPLDAITEWMYQGVRARFPGMGPPEADAYVARDRRIFKGRAESRDAWANRARAWLDTWRRAGSPFATLANLQAYFYPLVPTVRMVTDSGHWYWLDAALDANGMPVPHILPLANRPPAILSNWRWDAERGRRWRRVWIIVHWPPGFASQGFLWDAGPAWDSGVLWDGVLAAVLSDLYDLSISWLPAHTMLSGIIATELQPTDDIPGHAGRHPFDPFDVSLTDATHWTSLPVENWASPVWTFGPSIGAISRPPWANFYNVRNF